MAQNDDKTDKAGGGIETTEAASSLQSSPEAAGAGTAGAAAAAAMDTAKGRRAAWLAAAWGEAVFLLTTREGLIGDFECAPFLPRVAASLWSGRR